MSPSSRARLMRLFPAAFALAGMVLVFVFISFGFGQAPLDTLFRVFESTWGTPYGIGQVLFKASPLILTGLAFHVALRAGLFNIGAEGQLALASLAGAVVAAKLPAGTPAAVAIFAALSVAMLAGVAAAAVPTVLRARLGVHEIISFILVNRIADVLVPWLLVAVIGAAALRTADIVPGAALPRLDIAAPSLRGSAASAAFPIAVAAAFGVHELLRRTRAGREMRWVGLNPDACRAEGIDVYRRLIQAGLISGALAASAMLSTVLGHKGYFELGMGAGAGLTGVAVALLGCGTPLGIVLAAVLFGTLEQAGLAINALVPKDAMTVLQAVVILLVATANGALKSKVSGAPDEPPSKGAPISQAGPPKSAAEPSAEDGEAAPEAKA